MRRLAVLGSTLLAAIAAAGAVSGPARADTAQASPPSCAVSYGSIAVWSGQFYTQIDVEFSGFPAGSGWVLTFDFASTQERIIQVPDEQWSQVGEHVVITNSSQLMPTAGSLPLSFITSYSTVAPLPVNYTFDGVACTAPIGVALCPPHPAPARPASLHGLAAASLAAPLKQFTPACAYDCARWEVPQHGHCRVCCDTGVCRSTDL